MAWLLKLAGRGAAAALRGGGRLVSEHVIPDSITPWDIRRNTSRASRTLSRSISSQLKKRKKKKKAKAMTSKPGKGSKTNSRPSATTRQRFDKNSWNQGRGMRSADKWDEDLKPRAESASSSRSRFAQQLRDVAKQPGLVLVMKADELTHQYRQNAKEYGQQARRNLRDAGSRLSSLIPKRKKQPRD